MEKQKIFFLIIMICALFIVFQQGSLLFTSHRYESQNYGVSRKRLVNNDLSRFSLNDLKNFNSRNKNPSNSHSRRFSFIERFVVYKNSSQFRVLLLSYFRSGSSFIGDLLQQNWKSFYSFEPLQYMTKQSRIGSENVTEALNLITDIYDCRFYPNTSYIEWIAKYQFLIRWNRFLWNICNFHSSSMCSDTEFLTKICERSKYSIIKTVRLKVKYLEYLFDSIKTKNLKIIYLVRDPRGVYNSRKQMEWCSDDLCTNITSICNEMRQDLFDYDRLDSKVKSNVVLVRYEDISLNPIDQAKKLFSNIGLDFSPNVLRFLRTHTKSYNENELNLNPYSTYRANSSSTAYQWIKELNHTEINFAQKVCSDVLQRLNYKII